MIKHRHYFAKLLIPTLALFLFSLAAPCQKPIKETRSKLQLQLKLGEFRDGLPTQFVILLRNISKENVSVPETEYVNCRNLWRGTVNLHVAINGGEGISLGCPGDGLPEQIEVRALSWHVLRPGESLQLGTRDEHLQLQNLKTGKYAIWADYTPPKFSEADRVWLKTAGINVPQSQLTSRSYEFKKE
jgi:hypothetical protein